MTIRAALAITLGILLLAQVSEAAVPTLTDLSVSPYPAIAGGTVYVTVSKTGRTAAYSPTTDQACTIFSAASGAQQVEFVALFRIPRRSIRWCRPSSSVAQDRLATHSCLQPLGRRLSVVYGVWVEVIRAKGL